MPRTNVRGRWRSGIFFQALAYIAASLPFCRAPRVAPPSDSRTRYDSRLRRCGLRQAGLQCVFEVSGAAQRTLANKPEGFLNRVGRWQPLGAGLKAVVWVLNSSTLNASAGLSACSRPSSA